jgi:type VI protein secretion system component Hcp
MRSPRGTVNLKVPCVELSEDELSIVSGGDIIIRKFVDKASPNLFMAGGGGTPSLEYWLSQLMF